MPQFCYSNAEHHMLNVILLDTIMLCQKAVILPNKFVGGIFLFTISSK
jgi:hypothetical protein